MNCPFKDNPAYRSAVVIGTGGHIDAYFSSVEDAQDWAASKPGYQHLRVYVDPSFREKELAEARAALRDPEEEIKRLKTRINQLIGSVHSVGSAFRAWVPENL